MNNLSEYTDVECPVWGTLARRYECKGRAIIYYSSRAGGYFCIPLEVIRPLEQLIIKPSFKAKFSKFVYERQREFNFEDCYEQPINFLISTNDLNKIDARKSISYSQKKENFFRFLINENPKLGQLRFTHEVQLA